MGIRNVGKLNRELNLWDIVALSIGAMISAGFFLLPGIAAQQAGPSVFLAYFLAALLMLPAMFSMAELATATPKAGELIFSSTEVWALFSEL
jgi:basic amino acid/polyamine antiporter, APA family